MSAAQHTRGPRHTGGHAGVEMVIYDKDGWAIADARPYHSKRTFPEAQANAQLVAAAPELLEVLQLVAPELRGLAFASSTAAELVAKIDAVLAKATGGAS